MEKRAAHLAKPCHKFNAVTNIRQASVTDEVCHDPVWTPIGDSIKVL
jgi:hypothetical protein